jgi:hypothetical protein
MKLKQHCRAVCRGIAILLLVAGLFCAYWWFYKLGPSRRTLSLEWRSSHSEREYWREVQKGIYRGMWFHDDGLAVGMYGDKSWAEWIMAHVTRGEDMSCLGSRLCHSATAMCYITNQDVGEDADAWLGWWVKNKSKSQDEWMADGFRRSGFAIDVPPSFDRMPALLGLLGKSDTNESAGVREHLKYNAFRCLRDSDFDPVKYAMSGRPFSREVERGLLEYARRQRCWPAANGVGILSFGKTDDEGADVAVPMMLTPKFQLVAYSLIFTPLVLGAGLLAWSFRRRTACAHHRR